MTTSTITSAVVLAEKATGRTLLPVVAHSPSPSLAQTTATSLAAARQQAERRIAGGKAVRACEHATSLRFLSASSARRRFFKMPRATSDAKLLIQSLTKAYAATPTNLKIIDLYVICAVATALMQLSVVILLNCLKVYDFNLMLFFLSFCLRIQVNKDNKEFKDLPPERAFADFILCNLVLHLVIMNFLG
nr:unnamed protein product [Digitaria exilis]